jgi:hypothetical protein
LTVSVTHAKVSGQAAGDDPNRVYGTHWDAAHTVPLADGTTALQDDNATVLMTPESTWTAIRASTSSFSMDTLGDAEAATISPDVKDLVLFGYYVKNDLGQGAQYARVDAEPAGDGKFRSIDRYMSNGLEDASDGGWWEIQNKVLYAGYFGCDEGVANNEPFLDAWMASGTDLKGHAGVTLTTTSACNVGLADSTIDFNGMTIELTTASVGVSVLVCGTKDNVSILNGRFNGRKDLKTPSGAHASYGIRTVGCNNLRIEGCEIYNTVEHAIDVVGSATDTDSTKILIARNLIHDVGTTSQQRGYAIWMIEAPDDVVVADNVCWDNVGVISIDDSHSGGGYRARRVVMSGNYSHCYTDAFRLEGSAECVVTGNIGIGEGGMPSPDTGSDPLGIWVRDIQENEGSEWTTITGNYFKGARCAALFHDAQAVTFSSNICVQDDDYDDAYAEGYCCIDILTETTASPARGIIIANNILDTYDGIGIRVAEHPDQDESSRVTRLTIANNQLRFRGGSSAVSGQEGLVLKEDVRNYDVNGNLFIDFYDSISCGTADTATNTIQAFRNNTMIGSERYGIQLTGAGYAFLTGNVSKDATTADFQVEAAANVAGTVLADNVFTTPGGTYSTITQLSPSAGLTFYPTTATWSAFILSGVQDQTMTGGYRITPLDLGTVTTGTTTLDPGDREIQYYINGGAHTLAPGANPGLLRLKITNNASAGAITTSGFTYVTGSAFDTTNGSIFLCDVYNDGTLSRLSVVKLL